MVRFAGIAAILACIGVSCGPTLILSRWAGPGQRVDGDDAEWGGTLTVIEDGKGAVGVANDSANLYLCLKVVDRTTQMQIVRLGCTVWFDSTGGDDHVLGVHFPLGFRGTGQQGRWPEEGSREEAAPAEADLVGTLHEMEIVGSSGTVIARLPGLRAGGLHAAISDSTGAIIYELAIPLRAAAGFRFAAGAAPGSLLGVGFETGEFVPRLRTEDRSSGGEGGGRRGGSGGFGRGGGRGAGRGSGPPGEGRSGRPEPLKVWTQVRLALGPGV
jgi:hypothetical protein